MPVAALSPARPPPLSLSLRQGSTASTFPAPGILARTAPHATPWALVRLDAQEPGAHGAVSARHMPRLVWPRQLHAVPAHRGARPHANRSTDVELRPSFIRAWSNHRADRLCTGPGHEVTTCCAALLSLHITGHTIAASWCRSNPALHVHTPSSAPATKTQILGPSRRDLDGLLQLVPPGRCPARSSRCRPLLAWWQSGHCSADP